MTFELSKKKKKRGKKSITTEKVQDSVFRRWFILGPAARRKSAAFPSLCGRPTASVSGPTCSGQVVLRQICMSCAVLHYNWSLHSTPTSKEQCSAKYRPCDRPISVRFTKKPGLPSDWVSTSLQIVSPKEALQTATTIHYYLASLILDKEATALSQWSPNIWHKQHNMGRRV